MYLWEMYGDPHIPPFPKDLIPPIVVASSPDEITTPKAHVVPINPIPAIVASNLV